ncbi:universal stress protein family protein [Paraburkholderia sp. BL6665CI2N2]|nr:universal stress protein family protein [Paraburkholderia sp. BL6665CI2N2]
MFKHLLVPTDGSALSEAALQMTVTLAMESGAKVTGLHVIPECHVLAYGTEMIADTEERVVQATRQHVEDYLAVIAKAAAQAGVECDMVATNRAYRTRRSSALQHNEIMISSSWRLTDEAACARCYSAAIPRRS